jgi:hypothetical protein
MLSKHIVNIMNFQITNCDISDVMLDSMRFSIHIFLLHMLVSLIDKKERFLHIEVFKTVFYTIISLTIYHCFIKKMLDVPMKNLKKICDNEKVVTKQKK